VTIDLHSDTRGCENDIAPVMKTHPELLRIGLDESTSITAHDDTLTRNGPRRAAIWDGKGYCYFQTGASLDPVTHSTPIEAPRYE
jgi:cyanophycinase-like exopeptidase